jgi:hypothetical protein
MPGEFYVYFVQFDIGAHSMLVSVDKGKFLTLKAFLIAFDYRFIGFSDHLGIPVVIVQKLI